MKLSVLENTPKVFRFKLDKASTNFANAIRRIAINSVMSFAIDTRDLLRELKRDLRRVHSAQDRARADNDA